MTPKRKFRKVAQQLKRKTMLAIIAMLIVGAGNAQKPKLAVMDFMAGVGLYQNDVNGLSDMLINSLFNTGRFELIERGQLSELIGETNLQKSSLSAGQLQQLAIKGVNFLLLGRVNLTGGEYNIDVRVVDVGTGQLYSTAGVTKLSGQTYREMMPKLANELATKLPQTVNATVTVIPAEKPKTTSVITLLGYLQVYPDDLGEFSSAPTSIIANINRQELYGYNDWRLPTQEELDLMRANSSKLGLKNNEYMVYNGRAGNVRLVTTGKTVTEKKEAHEATRTNGVQINGVIWATCNVGTVGTFVSNHGECGKYYTFEEAQKVCPQGWRLPTASEFIELLKSSYTLTRMDGVYGLLVGTESRQIFFSACGYFENEKERFRTTKGSYWSCGAVTKETSLHFDDMGAWVYNKYPKTSQTVRCVREE